MLPTKGYFQDIECPFNKTCGRPYCHFRHKRKPSETIDDNVNSSKSAVPTYKPTPKSELANIHNNRSHIPISYVPDLAFKRERSSRPVRIDNKPTYKPTPLSILSSATKTVSSGNQEDQETIKDIQENIASNVYDPFKSAINFDELGTEFDALDEIIDNPDVPVNKGLVKLENDIEKEQNKLNILQSGGNDQEIDNEPVKCEKQDIKPIISKEVKSESSLQTNGKDKDEKKSKSSDKDKTKSSERSDKRSKESKSERSSKSHKSSDRDKHRKEEKKNSSKESKDRHKSKHKSRDRSKSPKKSTSRESSADKHKKKSKSNDKKSKSRHRSRSRSASREKSSKSRHKSKRSRSRSRHRDEKKDKKSSKSKEKSTEKDKSRSKGESSKSKTKSIERNPSTSESKASLSDNDLFDNDLFDDEVVPEDPIISDVDLEDDDETMLECYKIFNEYKPEPIRTQPKIDESPKRESVEDESNPMHHGKKRKAHAGAENSTTTKLPPVAPPKATILPGQILTNRYKMAKLAQANNEQENIMNEVKAITQQPIKRPATSLLEAARMHKMKRLEKQKAEREKYSNNVVDAILNGVHKPTTSPVKVVTKKIAAVPNVALIEKAKQRISLVKQSIKNVTTVAHSQKGGRVAHVPEYTLAEIPDVLQAEKSKLPVNVRTRFLTMIGEECSKLYISRDDAYNRALNEEFACYEKCKVLATYKNSAMLAVSRLRKEIQERDNKGLGPLLTGENLVKKEESDYEGLTFYNHVKKWLLTDEELDIHGYPRQSDERGKAIINNRTEIDFSRIDQNQRKCSRCGRIYQVDDDGWPLYEEECMYHPNKKRTLRGQQIYLCCKSNDDTGCVTSDTHVFDGYAKHLLEGYQKTLPPQTDDDPRSIQVYALDCEMCYTTKGLELTRVTIVDTQCKTVYESFVKPLSPIIDYNTRFSGITKEQMDKTSTSILQVQANILHLCNSQTVLVGHSLESDMKALKIIHTSIIDTSVLFPHKMGLPHKRALRSLASEYLKKIIQNDVAGHDSAEDAIACMDLIKWKLKEDLKVKSK